MPWRLRAITPWHLPVRAEPDGRTYDPGLEIFTRRIERGLPLLTHPVWQLAPLTHAGRTRVPAQMTQGWEVRRIGAAEPCAIVLRMMGHTQEGLVVSASPERAVLEYTDRLLVVTPDRVLVIRGADEGRAFGLLADLMLGTHRAPRRRRAPAVEAPVEDLDVLQALAR